MQTLDAELDAAPTEADSERIKKLIKEREEALLPMYLQVSSSSSSGRRSPRLHTSTMPEL